MFKSIRGRAGALGLALALMGMLGAGLLAGTPGVGAAPAAREKAGLAGRIHVMALDSVGGGYAWADTRRHGGGGGEGGQAPHEGSGHLAAPVQAAAAQATPEPYSLLLRMEQDQWFVLADSNTAP